MTLSKQQRHFVIKELIQSRSIGSQEELAHVLVDEHRVHVAQATLSRDLSELGIVKAPTEDGFRYVLQEVALAPLMKQLLRIEITGISSNESTVVVRTLRGRAPGVSEYLDRLGNPDILGSLAGDDTVLFIPSSHTRIEAIVAWLRQQIMGETLG